MRINARTHCLSSLTHVVAMMHIQFAIPTPCSPKRPMDEQLCTRFHKRLRLEPPVPDAVTGLPLCADASDPHALVPTYTNANSLLCRLHMERMHRKQVDFAMNDGALTAHGTVSSCSGAHHSGCASNGTAAGAPITTHFTLADVVHCNHGAGGRCLQCSGRKVQDVPLQVYGAFQEAYAQRNFNGSCASAATTSVAAMRRVATAELSFAALAALFARLAPERNERLLHLGSGSGRTVAAWSLMIGESCASGVEGSAELHSLASSALANLSAEVQRRVFLHCGDVFATRGDWHHANIIIISSNVLDESTPDSIADALQIVEAGTRVVTFSRPLSSASSSRAPHGFTLEGKGLYRTVGNWNSFVFIYRKAEPE